MRSSIVMRIGEVLLNSISVLAAAYLLIFATTRLFFPRPMAEATEEAKQPLVGRNLASVLPEVDWSTAPQSLVLFTRSTCPWCQKSVPFHRQLVALGAKSGIPTIAVSDEPLPTLRAILLAQQLEVTAAISASVGMLGGVGTPTLALVDSRGNITHIWQGYLEGSRQTDVLSAVTKRATEITLIEADAGESLINAPMVPNDEIHEFAKPSRARLVVDIRPRDQFATEHIAGAINIPEDELELRAVHEIPPGAQVAVFCNYQSDCESKFRATGAPTVCTMSTMLLRSMGIDARLLTTTLSTNQSAGFSVSRSLRLRATSAGSEI